MSHIWQLQEAQNQLSEVIDNAEKYGAQIINYQGKAKAVMLSMAKYQQLINPQKNTLVKFFQQSPLYGVSLDLERDKETGREINLE
jgi:antitoxin Phd